VDSALAVETARQWFGLAVSPAGEDDRWITDGLAGDLAGERRGPIHRLRALLGDSLFSAGIVRFTGDHRHQPVTRADFLSAMSASAGRDLSRDLDRALDRGR
jgi:hypothetical protein